MTAVFRSRSVSIVPLLILLSHSIAFGWGDVGHEVVAKIAWSQLDEPTKAKVTTLLKELSPHYAEASSISTAARIADAMRPGVSAFNSWHYIDIPYAVGMEVPVREGTNIVTTLCECVRTLKAGPKSKATPFEKAFMLQFFLHLVGDIHQPLHCAVRYTPLQPTGNQGGNLFIINVDKKPTNLHLYWDLGLGVFGDVHAPYTPKPTESPMSAALADSIMKEFPITTFKSAIASTVFREWALDSHTIAREKVYDLSEGYEPDSVYVKNGQKIAKERVALAGYRLGFLLKNLLAESSPALTTGCP